jgi:hypothetical protein
MRTHTHRRAQVTAGAYNYATGKGNGRVNITHFAQLVWKNTLRLGCAYKRCAAVVGLPGWVDVDLIVCRYDPPGALLGQFQANVLQPGGAISSTAAKRPPPKAGPKRPPPPAKPLRPPPKVMARTNPPNRPPPKVAVKAPPPVRPPPTGSAGAGSFQPTLDLHNTYRRRHKAPPLAWDATIAATAAGWASKCVWGHDGGNSKYGENLFILAGAPFNQSSGLEIWYNEVGRAGWGAREGRQRGGLSGRGASAGWAAVLARSGLRASPAAAGGCRGPWSAAGPPLRSRRRRRRRRPAGHRRQVRLRGGQGLRHDRPLHAGGVEGQHQPGLRVQAVQDGGRAGRLDGRPLHGVPLFAARQLGRPVPDKRAAPLSVSAPLCRAKNE